MSDLLSIGASGVKAYQSALTTVSENIANVGVAGYSRRTSALREVATTAGTYAGGTKSSGSGVLVAGIDRASDEYASAAVRSSGADLARTATGATWLTTIDSALSDNKLSDRLTSFFTASRSLASQPTSSSLRTQMLGAASSAALAFTATGQALDKAGTDLANQANSAAQTLQGLATTLANVNGGLGRVGADSGTVAQLSDQRDQILEQMSALVDVNSTLDSYGRATVTVGGAQGPTLVSGVNTGTVGYRTATDGTPTFSITNGVTQSVLTPAGGAMAGMVDGAQKISAARAALNGVASDFTTKINTIQANGEDLNGAAGTPMFTTGGTPTDITLALTDPATIAAASVGGGIRNADNLGAIEALRTSTGAETGVATIITENATALNQRQTIADAQSAIHDGAVGTRDSVSGVNLDSEAVDLMRYQQAYSASSRVIQVARDTFQSILDIR